MMDMGAARDGIDLLMKGKGCTAEEARDIITAMIGSTRYVGPLRMKEGEVILVAAECGLQNLVVPVVSKSLHGVVIWDFLDPPDDVEISFVPPLKSSIP